MNKITIVTDRDYFPDTNGCFGLTHRFTKEYCEQAGIDLDIITPEEAARNAENIHRVIDRTLNYDGTIEAMHQALAVSRALYLNSPAVMEIFASKVGLYEELSDLNESLIPTSVLESESDFVTYMRQNVGRNVVLKPEYGGMGNSVLFISIISSQEVRVRWHDGQSNTFTGGLTEVYEKYVEKRVRKKHDRTKDTVKTRWVGQDFIPFSRVNGGVVDIRVIKQAILSGGKGVSAMYGRRASGEVPITNLEKEGDIVGIDRVIREAKVSIEQILELCEAVENIVELKTGTIIGELGHDIGITESGRLIYIEGNTMPGYVYSEWGKIQSAPAEIGFNRLSDEDRILITTPMNFLSQT